jgi:hypothetical protein
MTRYKTNEVAELVRASLRYRTMTEAVGHLPRPEPMYRRLYDILNDKTETVTLGVFDQIALAFDHPEWLHILEPV